MPRGNTISLRRAPKKSLTDATKKALSQLGFSADIFLGLYDNPQYREEIGQEFAIKNASDKAEDVARLRKELDEKLSRNAEFLASGGELRHLESMMRANAPQRIAGPVNGPVTARACLRLSDPWA